MRPRPPRRTCFNGFFSVKQARRLYAYVEDNNIPSQRLCERLGMRREGLFMNTCLSETGMTVSRFTKTPCNTRSSKRVGRPNWICRWVRKPVNRNGAPRPLTVDATRGAPEKINNGSAQI